MDRSLQHRARLNRGMRFPGGTLDPSEELLAHYTTYVAAWRAADFLDMLIAEEGTR